MRGLAIDSMKISPDEYQHLRQEHDQDWIVYELQKRSLEMGITAYNLADLRESLLKDQILATRSHHEWQPSEVWRVFYLENVRSLLVNVPGPQNEIAQKG